MRKKVLIKNKETQVKWKKYRLLGMKNNDIVRIIIVEQLLEFNLNVRKWFRASNSLL